MTSPSRVARGLGWLAPLAALALGCSAGVDAGVDFADASPRRDARPADGAVDTGAAPRDTGAAGGDTGAPPATDTGGAPPVDGGGGPRENCATPWDENNDGRANENCPCTPGSTQMCFQRPEDQFQGMCRMGSQRCEGTGEFGMWSACERAWLPLPDHMNQCQATQRFAEMSATRAPVDIVWFVDTSGSMTEETRYVNTNLNRFATTMAASGLDYRVVMIARRGTGSLMVCVPSPLGGAGCGDGPRFRHIDQYVSSTNGLSLLVSTYPRWRDFLRPTSVKFFVAVTDDESSLRADSFDMTVRSWPGFSSYVFNSIVGYNSRSDCPTLARPGLQYLDLTRRTRGDQARVCASDWSSIFTSFATGIAARVNAWTLAAPARPETIQVWVVAPDGTRTRLTTGWTYDMAANRVTIDPARLPPMGHTVEIVFRPAAASP